MPDKNGSIALTPEERAKCIRDFYPAVRVCDEVEQLRSEVEARIAREIRAAVEAERARVFEECAKLCDEVDSRTVNREAIRLRPAFECAEKIRARGRSQEEPRC